MKAKKLSMFFLLMAVFLFFGLESEAAAVTPLQDSDITVAGGSFTYDGKEKKPDVTVTCDGNELVRDTDYKVTYSDNINAGTAEIEIEGIGNYSGSFTRTFTIKKAVQPLKLSAAKKTINIKKQWKIGVSGNKGKLSFSSGRPGIAPVSAAGIVTGKHAGESNITVRAAETDNYAAASKKVLVTVKGYPLNAKTAKVTLSKKQYTYNGKKKSPKVTVKYGGRTLKKSVDYKVVYKNNINAGKATASVVGKGDYAGTINKTYTISKASQKLVVKVKKTKVHIGKKLKIRASAPGKNIVYKCSNTKTATVSTKGVVIGRHAGKVKIVVKARATKNYKAAKKKIQIEILRTHLSESQYKVKLSKKKYVYNGNARRPAVTVKGAEGVLEKGKDYTVTYSNNVNAGTARVNIVGIRDYEGKITKTFAIERAEQTIRATLDTATIRVGGTTKIKVKKKAGTLTFKSSDPQTASVYKGVVRGKNPGRATITVRANTSRNYKAATTTVVVTVRKSSLKEAKLKITITPLYATYTGNAIYPKVVIKDNGKKIVEGTDYVLTYKYNVNIGTAILTISGYGNYYGKISKNFFINPKGTALKKAAGAAGRKINLEWTVRDHITGYQIQYATDKNFEDNKLVFVKDPDQSQTTLSGLTAGKTYYVRIRTYTYVENDDTFVSDWSVAEPVKVAK